jgi:hypothetical protein
MPTSPTIRWAGNGFMGYFFNLSVALDNNSLEPMLDHSIRAQWLAFASQALLISLLYLLVAFKPHSVTREVIVLLGLLQMVECILLFAFSGSTVAAGLLIIASLFVLAGAAAPARHRSAHSRACRRGTRGRHRRQASHRPARAATSALRRAIRHHCQHHAAQPQNGTDTPCARAMSSPANR